MFVNSSAATDAGIVDQDIDRGEAFNRCLDEPAYVVRVSDIRLYRNSGAAGILDLGHCIFQWCLAPAAHDDTSTFARQCNSYTFTDTGTAAGYNGSPVS